MIRGSQVSELDPLRCRRRSAHKGTERGARLQPPRGGARCGATLGPAPISDWALDSGFRRYAACAKGRSSGAALFEMTNRFVMVDVRSKS